MSFRTNRRTRTVFPVGQSKPRLNRLRTLENGWTWKGAGNAGEFQVDIEKFLKIFGLEDRSPDRIQDLAYESPPDFDFSDYEKELQEQGLTPDQIMEKIQEAEDKEIGDQVLNYQNDLENAIESYLTSHPIRGISSVHMDWGNGKARIEVENLDELLTSERQVMNGVGMFEAGSNQELIASSGKSKVGAVASHFGWLSSAAEVYGTSSIQRILDRRY